MPQDVNHDVMSIREWLAKEAHLPEDFSDMLLKKFLHSCYGSLERTKKCIERFCTYRSETPELYTDKDPLSPKMQTAFEITRVTTYQAAGEEILIHTLDDPNLEYFNFYDDLKSFMLQSDYWLEYYDFFAENHILVVDMKCYFWRILTKVNLMFYKDFLIYLLEAMPVRVKEIHAVNCPPYYEKMYALIKNVLPAEIRNIIHFHETGEGLHKFVDKKYLPVDFGGEAQNIKDQQLYWVGEIEKKREWLRDENRWKADLKKKPKNSVENTMNGSFRTLSID